MFQPLDGKDHAKREYREDTGPKSKVPGPDIRIVEDLEYQLKDD